MHGFHISHENTKLSDHDSALDDHLSDKHVALMFGKPCSTKSSKVMRLDLTNQILENFLQLLEDSKFSLWEYFWRIIVGMKTDMPIHTLHSQKKGYRNSTPGVLLLQTAPFFSEGCFFSLIIMFVRKKHPYA